MKIDVFLREAIMFAGTFILGLFVAFKYLSFLPAFNIVEPSTVRFVDLVIFGVLIFFVWLISRMPRLASWFFWIFLAILILSGSQTVIGAFFNFPADIIGALFILVLFFIFNNVLVHDFALMMAISGISATVGILISPVLGIYALVLLSFYDIIAVYKTRHMVQMARSMISSGAVFGIIIPPTWKTFISSRREATSRIGSDFAILGSGDIGLPLVFVSSLVRQSLLQAVIVSVFAVVGLLVTHILFIKQKERKAMAALPPIATMTIIGYLFVLLIFK